MIKGLAITPPVIGRISIGKVVERNGKRLPEKDDSFTLTTQVQNKDGWVLHPLHAKLSAGSANEKIRSIPVKLLFNATDLNLRAEYALFDRNNGRPMCVGNGESAKTVTPEGVKSVDCPGPDTCELGRKNGCKPYGRLNVQVDGQEDELATFIFRTTGFNSIRTLTARLRYFEAVSGGTTKHLPLQLKLRAKSTTQSHRAPVYYVDLCLREGVALDQAVSDAKAQAQRMSDSGVDVQHLEEAARVGLANGAFEDSEDEVPAIVEEFYSGAEDSANAAQATLEAAALGRPRLTPRPSRLTDRLGKAETAVANQGAA